MRRLALAARLAPTIAIAGALLGFFAVAPHSAAAGRPYVTDLDPAVCAAGVAYLEQHAEPRFAIECPVNLPAPEVSITCVPKLWSAGCTVPVIRLSPNACPTAVKDEASNSWVLSSYVASRQIPDRVRQGGVPDWPGQYGLDNFGEC